MVLKRSFIKLITVLALILFLAAALQACTTTSPTISDIGDQPANVSIDIFSARGHLSASNYERHRIQGDLAWRECGDVVRIAKKSPDSPQLSKAVPLPKLLESDVSNLSEKEKLTLQKEAIALFSQLPNVPQSDDMETDDLQSGAPQTGPKLPAPGSVFSLLGPGLLELSISVDGETKRVVTSLDAVSDC